jgi:hypothetical protein
VFKLCWDRGYVLITLGGGITPVVQTCDTDLNQHVKKHDIALETAELLQQMRDGINVPSNPPERCIDSMASCASQTKSLTEQRSWSWTDKQKDLVMSNNGLGMIACGTSTPTSWICCSRAL